MKNLPPLLEPYGAHSVRLSNCHEFCPLSRDWSLTGLKIILQDCLKICGRNCSTSVGATSNFSFIKLSTAQGIKNQSVTCKSAGFLPLVFSFFFLFGSASGFECVHPCQRYFRIVENQFFCPPAAFLKLCCTNGKIMKENSRSLEERTKRIAFSVIVRIGFLVFLHELVWTPFVVTFFQGNVRSYTIFCLATMYFLAISSVNDTGKFIWVILLFF